MLVAVAPPEAQEALGLTMDLGIHARGNYRETYTKNRMLHKRDQLSRRVQDEFNPQTEHALQEEVQEVGEAEKDSTHDLVPDAIS